MQNYSTNILFKSIPTSQDDLPGLCHTGVGTFCAFQSLVGVDLAPCVLATKRTHFSSEGQQHNVPHREATSNINRYLLSHAWYTIHSLFISGSCSVNIGILTYQPRQSDPSTSTTPKSYEHRKHY